MFVISFFTGMVLQKDEGSSQCCCDHIWINACSFQLLSHKNNTTLYHLDGETPVGKDYTTVEIVSYFNALKLR